MNGVTIACTDSGSTDDLSGIKNLFEYVVPIKHKKFAVLGDDKTQLRIHGYGMMNYFVNGLRIRKMGYYVPGLSTTLISIKQHMKYDGCFFHAENNEAVLAYPAAIVSVKCNPEMHVNISSAVTSNKPYTFDETSAILSQPGKRRNFTVIDTITKQYLPKNQLHTFTNAVRVKKLVKEAILPSRATPGAAGFDVYSSEQKTIAPHSQLRIHTGLAMAIPKGMYLRIASRSSLASKGINVGAGVIDNDYCGEIQVVLQNTTSKPIEIPFHSRIESPNSSSKKMLYHA